MELCLGWTHFVQSDYAVQPSIKGRTPHLEGYRLCRVVLAAGMAVADALAVVADGNGLRVGPGVRDARAPFTRDPKRTSANQRRADDVRLSE
jgi:hypothetical protein